MLPSRDPNRIPWQRYWIPHTGTFHQAELGYLVRPTPEKRFNLQPDVVTYDQVAARPFLALMGETGSGKTDAIIEIGHSLRDSGQNVHYIDLVVVDTGEALRRELETSKRHAEGGNEVTLLFDQYEVSGLGEATDKHIAHVLSEFPQGKTKVRLGCRSGSWTAETERQFLKHWPDLLALEICPLTREDVTLALSPLNANTPDLLSSLEKRELAPLLIRPVTLRLIMSMIARGDDISSWTITDVYRKGLTHLVGPAPGQPHTLEGLERLAVARRMAAASVFCRRPIISESPDDGVPLAGTMHVTDLARGEEPTNEDGDSVRVSEVAVAEVLRHAGLLNSRGTSRHGWVHSSYAEFLAAEYVRLRHMPSEQIHGLLRLRDDGSPIIPELQGVVSWLLTNEGLPFGDEFISKWPTAVLRSDVQSLTGEQRERLVAALLSDAERGVLDTRSAVVRLRLGKLAHPNLSPQLEFYLTDKNKSLRTRGLAMQIAASCKLNGLATPIASIALDKSEPLHVREKAAGIVAIMSDEGAHKALLPLADPGDDADVDDQLRGAAFEVLWPKHMSSKELFRRLSDPRNDGFVGFYAMFLGGLSEQLSPGDLEPALAWASGDRSLDNFGRIRRVVDDILFLAFANLNRPGVLDRVADILIARASGHLQLFEEDGDDRAPLDAASRRLLVAHLAKRLRADELSKVVLWARPSLLDPGDAQWLVSQHGADTSGPWPHLLSGLVLMHHEMMMGEHLGTLSDAADAFPSVREALRSFLGPIVVDSPEAERAREQYKWQQRWAVRAAADSEEGKRRAILEAVLAGNVGQFIDLAYALADTRDGLGLDLVTLPGWERLSPEQQELIHVVAQEYLATRDEDRARWLGQNRYPYVAFAGYRALRLLGHQPGRLESLPAEVWAKWVGIVIAMPVEHEKEGAAQRDFIKHAGRVARDALDDALRTFITSDEMSGYHHLLSLFPTPWDADFGGLLEEAARGGSGKGRMSLVEAMLEASPERGEALAWDLVGEQGTPKETEQQLYALLARLGGAATRARVRQAVFSSSNETGREVIQLLASALEFKSRDMNQQMSASELAELYTWIEREFPAKDTADDDLRGVGRLRNDLLTSIGQRSTPDTVAALQSLVDAFPQHAYLRRMHHEAKERVATETWNPPTVSDLITLAKDPLKRFIESGEDLQTAIVESLRRFGVELMRTETPMAEFLWNDCPDCEPRFVSKDESALSNLVKRHLDLDLEGRGIVVNREVEVRRSGTGMGQRTDIHVRAVRRVPLDEARALTVIIETKKCSNASLMTALKGQLVEDYLKPLSLRYGIYLVGRFDNPAHRCCSAKQTLDALRAQLESQAKLVEPDYKVTAVVLDTALPSSMIPKTRTKQPRGPGKRTKQPRGPRTRTKRGPRRAKQP